MQGKTAKIGCGLFGVSKNFYNLNTLTYWRLRYGFSYRILHQETTQKIANPCKSRIYRGFYFGRNAKKLREAGYPQSVRIFLKKPTILAPVQFKKNPRIACDTRDQ